MCLRIRKHRRRRDVVAAPRHTGLDGAMGCGLTLGQSGRCPREASGETQCWAPGSSSSLQRAGEQRSKLLSLR